MKNDNKNKNKIQRLALRLLSELLTRGTVQKNLNSSGWLNMGRISVDLPDALEKQLRLKTVERFGGKKGDLSKAVEEAVKTWIVKKE
jgi:hypothetical protein